MTNLSLVRTHYTTTCRRTFFTFPKLPDFGFWNTDPIVQTYNERKVLPYCQEELYEIVSDVTSYNRFIPFCTGSRIVRPLTEVSASETHTRRLIMDAELTVSFLAFKESYVSRVTCEPHSLVEAVASSSTPLFKKLSTTWRFQPVPHSLTPSRTLVTLDLAYAFANPVHASVSSTFFGEISKLMVKAFEDRCHAVYGPR